MKKIISVLAIVAFLALTQTSFAAHEPGHGTGVGEGVGGTQPATDLAGGPDPDAGFIAGPTPAFSNDIAGGPDFTAPPSVSAPIGSVQERATAADLATEFQCGTGNNGSALEGAMSRLARRLGDSALDGIESGLRGRGTFGRMLSDIVGGDRIGDVLSGAGQDLASGLGNYAGDWISEELSGSCGDSSLGQRICNRVGNVVGDYVEGFITEQGGALIQSGLNSIGLGEAGGLVSGAFSGIVGSFFGGGDDGVPIVVNQQFVQLTNDRLNSVIGQVSSINALTEVEIRRVCEANPTVAALEVEAQAQAAATALEVGAERLVQNPSQAIVEAGREGQIAYCENLQGAARQRCVGWLLAQERGQSVNACGSTNFLDRLWNEENCDSQAREYDRFERARVNAQIAYMQSLDPALETTPLGFCPDRPELENATPADCTNFIRTLPASDVATSRQRAENLRFDISGKAIGEAAGGLITDIIEEITTVVENEVESGLKRLVRGSDSSGRRSSSNSFVDRLGGRSGNAGPSQQQGQNFLVSNITNSLTLEAEYQELTVDVVAGYESLIDSFETIGACYAAHAQTPPPGLTREQALAAVTNASTTLSVILEPQLTRYRQDLMRSQGAVSSLGVLLDQATASRGDALNTVAQNYDSMRQAGLLHSVAEIQFIGEELASVISSLMFVQDDANKQIQTCEGYTVI